MNKVFFILLFFTPFVTQAYEWVKNDTSVSLKKDGRLIWTHVHDPNEAKPFFHPLNTPSGTALTELKPKDHVWHRGLWFSWKFINGVNYWEEKNGRSAGTTSIQSVEVNTRKDFSAAITLNIDYFQKPGTVLLREKRLMEISVPKEGSYTISWKSEFTAEEKVFLDRTPVPGQQGGKSFGGYAGISVRAALDLRKQKDWTFVNENGEELKHGQPAKNVSFQGEKAAITIFIEGEETNKWYIAKGMPYFSPAILFENALTLEKGRKLNLSYKIKVEDRTAK